MDLSDGATLISKYDSKKSSDKMAGKVVVRSTPDEQPTGYGPSVRCLKYLLAISFLLTAVTWVSGILVVLWVRELNERVTNLQANQNIDEMRIQELVNKQLEQILHQTNSRVVRSTNDVIRPDCTCPAGPPGVKGDKGELGDAGTRGPSGFPGPVGFDGPTGVSGKKGEPGELNIEAIENNLQSLKGERGTPGPRGFPGSKGELSGCCNNNLPRQRRAAEWTEVIPRDNEDYDSSFGPIQGPPGPPGPPGPLGNTGPAGMKGNKGGRGLSGLNGSPGMIGPPGTRGMKGSRGDRGVLGHTGNQGVKGDVGEVGPAGEKGRRGRKGMKGVKGEPGAPGLDAPCPTGIDGLPLPGCQYK